MRSDETHWDHGARGGFSGGAEMVHGTILNTFWSRNSIRPAFNDFDSKSGSKYIVPAAPAPSKTCQFRRLPPWLRLCTPIEKDGPGSNDAVVLTQGLTFKKTEYRRGVLWCVAFSCHLFAAFLHNNGLRPPQQSHVISPLFVVPGWLRVDLSQFPPFPALLFRQCLNHTWIPPDDCGRLLAKNCHHRVRAGHIRR